MTFYLERAISAKALLTRRGRSITLERTTGESTDPVTGVVTGGEPDNKTTVGIFTMYDDGLIDGVLIKREDRLLVLAYDVQPLKTDTIDGMQIVNIEKVDPAGQVVVYHVQVRS